jgi:hypothetical protein
MKKLLLLAFLGGCATHTGVVKINDDTYMIGAQDYMAYSGSGVKAQLYKEANEFCAKQGKKVEPVADNKTDYGWSGHAGAEIQFRCK